MKLQVVVDCYTYSSCQECGQMFVIRKLTDAHVIYPCLGDEQDHTDCDHSSLTIKQNKNSMIQVSVTKTSSQQLKYCDNNYFGALPKYYHPHT